MLRLSIRNTPEVGQKKTAPPLPLAVAGEPSYIGGVSGLLSQDEVVVLLTALYEQVAVSDELG